MPIRMEKENILANKPSGTLNTPSSFMDNFYASFNYFFKNETFHSKEHYQEQYDARDQLIKEHENNGVIPPLVSRQLGNDNGAKAEWMLMNTDEAIETDEELEKQRAKMAQADKEKMVEVAGRANLGGKAGMFLGSMVGATTDYDAPVYLLSGYGLIGKSAKVLSSAGKAAALGLVVESAKQKVVQDNAYNTHQPRSAKEITQSIAFSTVGEAFFGGLGAAVNKVKTGAFAKQLRQLDEKLDIDDPAKHQMNHAIREADSGLEENAEDLIESVNKANVDYEEARPTMQIDEPDLADLELRQKQSRLEELQKKEKLDEFETDEVELLQAELKVKPKPEVEGATSHPVDDFDFLSPEEKQWLKDEGAELVPEIEAKKAESEVDLYVDCLLNNGVKI